jgi:hypothetical protein
MRNIMQQGQYNNLRWLIKRPDGSSIYMLECTIYYDNTQLSTHIRLGREYNFDNVLQRVILIEPLMQQTLL